ncbi:MAG: HNH endonuclease [Bdellovibrionales bacterium]|nr:HNH endonuclease [Bdellovibrionales bacterium]
MNLKNANAEELVSTLKTLVGEERRITTEILHYLSEVESRMIYAEMAYPSLYEFCTRYLEYSPGSAYRRIQSMRLLRELPETARVAAEEKIKNGSLNLTNLSLAHSFFKAEKRETGKVYSAAEKVDLIAKIENKSKREVEQTLSAIQPEMLKREKERVLSPDLVEIMFVANSALMSKLARAREVLSHSLVEGTYAELFETLVDTFLEHKDPMVKMGETSAKPKAFKIPPAEKSGPVSAEKSTVEGQSSDGGAWGSKYSRYIPIKVRRQVWRRDRGSCTYQDPNTGQKCGSRFKVELDHIEPHGLGGKNSIENLRLRCRTHNLFYAQKVYGKSPAVWLGNLQTERKLKAKVKT